VVFIVNSLLKDQHVRHAGGRNPVDPTYLDLVWAQAIARTPRQVFSRYLRGTGLQLPRQLGHGIKQIRDEPVISDLKDRRFFVLVDRDDDF
jgi:hypothetical protein